MRAPERYGRALVMTPWHVLAFGGYTHTKFEPLIWRFDPFTRKWSQEAVDAVAGHLALSLAYLCLSHIVLHRTFRMGNIQDGLCAQSG